MGERSFKLSAVRGFHCLYSLRLYKRAKGHAQFDNGYINLHIETMSIVNLLQRVRTHAGQLLTGQ